MKELYICHECGFVSTIWRDNYTYVHGEIHCLDCAKKEHGTMKSCCVSGRNRGSK